MSARAHKDSWELGREVADAQTRIFLRLVFDILERLEKYDQCSITACSLTGCSVNANHGPQIAKRKTEKTRSAGRGGSMSRSSQVPKFLMLACWLVLFLKPHAFARQSISEQKEAVVFIFGTIHPLNPDKTAMTDRGGSPLAVSVPLGTGFLVSYADHRHGTHHEFSYLVTAKHVLKDANGTFLSRVSIRLNLKSGASGLVLSAIYL
jgi:hypothetical protein